MALSRRKIPPNSAPPYRSLEQLGLRIAMNTPLPLSVVLEHLCVTSLACVEHNTIPPARH